MEKLKLRWVITNNRHNLVRPWAKKLNILVCTGIFRVKKRPLRWLWAFTFGRLNCMFTFEAFSFTKYGNNSGLDSNVIFIIYGRAEAGTMASILVSSKSFSWPKPEAIYFYNLVY